MASINLQFYDQLWSDTRLEEPQRFNTWPLIRAVSQSASERLEVGPGLRPRLPIEKSRFVDISRAALRRLQQRGATAVLGEITSLPFPDAHFDLVAAFDIIEHVADDRPVFRELARVLKEGGVFVFSVPLHARLWTDFDALVGHFRRYEPEALERSIAEHGFVLERSAIFGMQPRSRWLLDLATRMLRRHRATAMRWYNRVILPLGLFLQKPLRFEPGLISTENVDETILVCRRQARGSG
ncbi:MAG: class I SAM-dependent DNA methyltransferase [Candidatus Binatia bacterium]